MIKGIYFLKCSIMEAKKGARASEHQKVAEFINEDGRWRVEQLRGRLGEEIIKEIEAVPICGNAGKDRIVWPSTKDSKYSGKAWYHMIKETMKEGLTKKASSYHQVEENVWKMI